MRVQISAHAKLRAKERGASTAEIEETLTTGTRLPARIGRMCVRREFRIDEMRAGRHYSQKTIEVYYVVEQDVMVVVTVYVFYG